MNAEVSVTADRSEPFGLSADDGGVTLLDAVLILAKRKWIVCGVPLIASAVTLAILLFTPDIYTATARIMPPQQSDSTATALVGSLSGLAGGFGGSIGSALGLKNPNDLYVGILKSNTIADRLIQRFNLKERYRIERQLEARRALQEVTSITAGRDGLIVIEVDDEDPERAAALSNAYVEELDRLTGQLALSEAGKRRLFFERELAVIREKLGEAELALKATQEKTGLIQPDGQSKAIFEVYADLRARIAAKEVEVASLRSFATESNPDLARARQELAGLKSEAAKLETAQGGRREGDILVPTGRVPAAGLAYLRRMRDVKYHETLFELLAKQFEIAKIDEAKDAVIVQVVDRAVAPDVKAKPKRALITAMVAVMSSFASVLVALGCEARERALADPARAAKLSEVTRYLWGRRRGARAGR
jgi:uncharacterized protein involved in exopolysaccharide biosynthesis